MYLECVEFFFATNSIKDEKQVAVLLSVIGPKIYALLCDLLAPEKPQHKSVGVLFEIGFSDIENSALQLLQQKAS